MAGQNHHGGRASKKKTGHFGVGRKIGEDTDTVFKVIAHDLFCSPPQLPSLPSDVSELTH